MSEIDGDTFESVLTYLYTGKIAVRPENAARLAAAARFLQLEDELGEDCADFLGGRLRNCDLESFLEAW